MSRPIKLECYITVALKGLQWNKHSSLLGPFISYKKWSVVIIQPGLFSQHFIFFVTYKWPNKLECCITLALKGLKWDKHSSLLGPFISYKKWRVVIIHPGLYSQQFIFFVIVYGPNKIDCARKAYQRQTF